MKSIGCHCLKLDSSRSLMVLPFVTIWSEGTSKEATMIKLSRSGDGQCQDGRLLLLLHGKLNPAMKLEYI